MKRALFDLNVFLDVLLDRNPHAETSAALWRAVEERRLEGLVAAHGFPTLFYLVAKARDAATARRVVADLLSVFGVAPIDATTLRRASDLRLADFEDAVGAAAAEACGCDAIVTRDPRGFIGSPVEAIDPTLALAALDDEIREPSAAYGRSARRKRPRTRSALPKAGESSTPES